MKKCRGSVIQNTVSVRFVYKICTCQEWAVFWGWHASSSSITGLT